MEEGFVRGANLCRMSELALEQKRLRFFGFGARGMPAKFLAPNLQFQNMHARLFFQSL